ncbi:DUF3027 domain-containing protein [Actinomyces sp. zg-332]|uniref:DUF3027 domain-containing protein n=1 Tax=Actinomyces sp. zg-332 TaxID=2708340 RepID=UPI0014204F79|nr:DUF3027 domain-containing protein [Actinomyces sp. zg-332]QPK94338.1 DUF3027 domain-containing protein [Actinomyces sp. zg-332]
MQSVTSIQNMHFTDILSMEAVEVEYKNICKCDDCIFAFNKMRLLIEQEFNTRKANINASIETMKDAFDIAIEVLREYKNDEIGNYIGNELTDDFVVNHYYECLKKGYKGWKWAVSVACVEDQDTATVCEIDLLPGEDALLAPEWIPWEKRLLVSDFAPGEYVPEEIVERTKNLIEKRKAENLPPKLVEGKGIFSANWE